MAYMNQEKKAKLAPAVRAICKKYGVKASLAVRHHSTLVLNVRQGPIDFIGNFNQVAEQSMSRNRNGLGDSKYIDVNPYWYHEHFDGAAKDFLAEVLGAMNDGNHDRSDIMPVSLNTAWYVDVNIGKWDKPYALVK